MKELNMSIKSLTAAKYDLYRADKNLLDSMEAIAKYNKGYLGSIVGVSKQIMVLQEELGKIRDILEDIEATTTEK